MATTDTTGGSGLFFQDVGLFSIENAKFRPILANLSSFVANLRTFGGLYWPKECSGVPKLTSIKYEEVWSRLKALKKFALNTFKMELVRKHVKHFVDQMF